MSKYTEWYPKEITPARRGAYQTCHAEDERNRMAFAFQYWNGHRWGPVNLTPEMAKLEKKFHTHYHPIFWRGLKEPA